MKRREFLRFGAAAAGAPALLPTIDLSETRGSVHASAQVASDDPLILSSNVNPLGLPERLREAIVEGFDQVRLYPGAAGTLLAEKLAELHGIEPEGIVLGNGSTDILRMAVQAQVTRHPRVRVIEAEPTFEQVRRYLRPYGIQTIGIPLVERFGAHDLERMRSEARGAPDGVLVYVVNPHNPTGTLTSTADLRTWIGDAPPDHLFLIDEAYYRFVEDPGFETLERLAWERPNVVVVRTFSKVYSLAGLRLGYGVAHPETAAWLREFSVASSPNHLASIAGLAALDAEDFVRATLETVRISRRVAHETLDDLGLSYTDSHANLVFHEVGGDVETYRARMLDAGILVGRPFPPLLGHNRLALGLPQHLERWAETIRSFRRRGWV